MMLAEEIDGHHTQPTTKQTSDRNLAANYRFATQTVSFLPNPSVNHDINDLVAHTAFLQVKDLGG